MLRLRYWLLAFFGVLTILPVLSLTLWQSKSGLDRVFRDVHDRHLLIAQKLGDTLSIYHRDVKSMFELIAEGHNDWTQISGVQSVLDDMHFRHICIMSTTSRYIMRQTSASDAPCPTRISHEMLTQLINYAEEDKTVFTPVMTGFNGDNMIHLLYKSGSEITIGALKTNYIINLGKSVRFGEKGHATIVDQQGNVISHPRHNWIVTRKNLRDISAVQLILQGATGIEQFHSPEFKLDMIAGLTAVEDTGWGVMIAQPVIELEQRAWAENKVAQIIGIVSLIIIALLSFFISGKLSTPVERLTAAAEAASRSKEPEEAKLVDSFFTPLEHIKAQTAFNDMVRAIRVGSREMKRLAYSDTVTGLANRTAFERSVHKQIDLLVEKRTEKGIELLGHKNAKLFFSATLIYIDLDDFKAVNDTLGHHAGDELLRQIAKRLREVITDQILTHTQNNGLLSDDDLKNFQTLIARNGGDEFSIFIPHMNDEKDILALAERILSAINLPLTVAGEEVAINASVGLSRFPQDGRNLDVLTKKADIAMYTAKSNGKSCFRLYDPNIGEKTNAEICRDVIAGITNDEFILHYQPKICAVSGEVTSCEALVRWSDPSGGLVPPNAFIPAIERHKATILLGEFVVQSAMDCVKTWKDDGLGMHIAVNISTHHFASDDFVERMMMFAFEREIHPSLIELELTEESILENDLIGADKIVKLREFGFKITLDDFGRGYSNLTRLANLEFDVIKIDGPLVRNAVEDMRARVIVEATLNMAQGLGCVVVAEGVETLAEVDLMRSMGCDYLQGYHFAKPMPEETLTHWIKEQAAPLDISLFNGTV